MSIQTITRTTIKTKTMLMTTMLIHMRTILMHTIKIMLKIRMLTEKTTHIPTRTIPTIKIMHIPQKIIPMMPILTAMIMLKTRTMLTTIMTRM